MLSNRFVILKGILKKRPLMVALISAAVAATFAYGFLERKERELLFMAEPVQVVIAASDIESGDVIDEGSLTSSRVPRRFLQPGAFAKIEDVAGRLASVPIVYGSQVTLYHSRDARIPGGVAALIPAGMRTATISVDDPSGSLGIIRPNDKVDLLATFDLGSEAAVRRTTLTVAENIQVLAVNGMIYDIPRPARDTKKGGGLFGGSPPVPYDKKETILTLAAEPDVIQKIVFAMYSAEIAIVLRPFKDDIDRTDTKPTTISTITGQHDELISGKRNFREYRGR